MPKFAGSNKGATVGSFGSNNDGDHNSMLRSRTIEDQYASNNSPSRSIDDFLSQTRKANNIHDVSDQNSKSYLHEHSHKNSIISRNDASLDKVQASAEVTRHKLMGNSSKSLLNTFDEPKTRNESGSEAVMCTRLCNYREVKMLFAEHEGLNDQIEIVDNDD